MGTAQVCAAGVGANTHHAGRGTPPEALLQVRTPSSCADAVLAAGVGPRKGHFGSSVENGRKGRWDKQRHPPYASLRQPSPPSVCLSLTLSPSFLPRLEHIQVPRPLQPPLPQRRLRLPARAVQDGLGRDVPAGGKPCRPIPRRRLRFRRAHWYVCSRHGMRMCVRGLPIRSIYRLTVLHTVMHTQWRCRASSRTRWCWHWRSAIRYALHVHIECVCVWPACLPVCGTVSGG